MRFRCTVRSRISKGKHRHIDKSHFVREVMKNSEENVSIFTSSLDCPRVYITIMYIHDK